jgi:hypothetical protein
MITLSKLIRWSGMAFIVSGILLVVVTLLHPDIFESSLARVVLGTSWWTEIHILLFISTILALLGAAGLYLAQVEKTGVLGLVGFLLAFVGLIAMAGVALIEAFLMPALASGVPSALDWGGSFSNSVTYIGAGLGACYLAGFVMLGIATLRAGIFSRLGALLLAFGTPLSAIFEGPFVPFLGIASVLVLAVGQAWLGYELWATRSVAPVGERLAPRV